MAKPSRFTSPVLHTPDTATERFPFEGKALETAEMRRAMCDVFLSTLTTRLQTLKNLHDRFFALDPEFYGHLACWYMEKGNRNEHKGLFVAHLISSPQRDHREAAFVLIDKFQPAALSRIVDYCKRVYHCFPRTARTSVMRYLRRRERDITSFDHLMLGGRKSLKHLYASLRIKPDERAQRILFDNDPPFDSPLGALKRLAGERDPDEQVRLIEQNGIPYRVALSTIRNLTRAAVLLLVDMIPPQELMENLNILRGRGVLKDPEISSRINQKLRDIRAEKNRKRKKPLRLSMLRQISDAFVAHRNEVFQHASREKVSIRRSTAILVDKSGSMNSTLSCAPIVTSLCAALAGSQFYVYLFDEIVHQLNIEDVSVESVMRQYEPFSSEGPSSPGAALQALMDEKRAVEQILLLTDGNENSAPFFVPVYRAYQSTMLISPHIVVIKMGHSSDGLQNKLSTAGISHTIFTFGEDGMFLDQLIMILAGPTQTEMVDEIINTPLPVREREDMKAQEAMPMPVDDRENTPAEKSQDEAGPQGGKQVP